MTQEKPAGKPRGRPEFGVFICSQVIFLVVLFLLLESEDARVMLVVGFLLGLGLYHVVYWVVRWVRARLAPKLPAGGGG